MDGARLNSLLAFWAEVNDRCNLEPEDIEAFGFDMGALDYQATALRDARIAHGEPDPFERVTLPDGTRRLPYYNYARRCDGYTTHFYPAIPAPDVPHV